MRIINYILFFVLFAGFSTESFQKKIAIESELQKDLSQSISSFISPKSFRLIISITIDETTRENIMESIQTERTHGEEAKNKDPMPGFEVRKSKKSNPTSIETLNRKGFVNIEMVKTISVLVLLQEGIKKEHQDLILTLIKSKLQNTPSTKIDVRIQTGDLGDTGEAIEKAPNSFWNDWKQWASLLFILLIAILLMFLLKNKNKEEARPAPKEEAIKNDSEIENGAEINDFLVDYPEYFRSFFNSLSESDQHLLSEFFFGTPLYPFYTKTTGEKSDQGRVKSHVDSEKIKPLIPLIKPFIRWKESQKNALKTESLPHSALSIIMALKSDLRSQLFLNLDRAQKSFILSQISTKDKAKVLKELIEKDHSLTTDQKSVTGFESLGQFVAEVGEKEQKRQNIRDAINQFSQLDLEIQETLKISGHSTETLREYELDSYLLDIDDIFKLSKEIFTSVVEATSNQSLGVIANSLDKDGKSRLLDCVTGIRRKAVESIMTSDAQDKEAYLAAKNDFLAQYRRIKK